MLIDKLSAFLKRARFLKTFVTLYDYTRLLPKCQPLGKEIVIFLVKYDYPQALLPQSYGCHLVFETHNQDVRPWFHIFLYMCHGLD